jgi:hypothetical protein
MNERIRELAEQAWNDTREKFGSFVDDCGEIDYTFLHAYDQKFAELIVRECMKICKDHPSIIFKNEWDADVVSPDIVSRLESHFGVEE